LTTIYIKDKTDFFIFCFVLSTILKHDTKTITLSCTSLTNTILSLSLFLSYLVFHVSIIFVFFFFRLGTVSKCYLSYTCNILLSLFILKEFHPLINRKSKRHGYFTIAIHSVILTLPFQNTTK